MKKFGLFILIAGLSVSCSSQDQQYKIVYNVLHDTAKGNYEVYIMDMDGKDQKNISNYEGLDWVYRTYQNKIYFVSDRDTSCKRCYKLYDMDQQGNNIRKISDLVLEDSWMDTRNDGKEMIVSARIGRTIRNQLFLLNLQDGSYRQITNDTSVYHNDPVFSPDGKQIAFRHRTDRRDRNMKTEIYIMNDDGTGRRQLTYYPNDDTTYKPGEYHAGPPTWNKKDKFISYISFQKGQYQVYAITPDGKKQWQIQITNDPEMDAGYHHWTPDGGWLVMDMKRKGRKGYDIYLMNSKTKKLNQITTSWKYEQAPCFVEAK